MTHASLFSGIGGFDLAAQWMGWENAFHCEWNPFCQTVLKYYWPNATTYTDITTTDFTLWRGRVDVLTGGFPCQPFSTAGQQKGTADDRYLWPEMLRAIREIAPRYVVGENVDGIFTWNDGLVFETVCADLEAQGYEVQAYRIPACATGAPHRRDRWWFVAHASSQSAQCELRAISDEGRPACQDRPTSIRQTNGPACASGLDATIADATNPNRERQPQPTGPFREIGRRAGNEVGNATHSPKPGLSQPRQTGQRELSAQSEGRLHHRPQLSGKHATHTGHTGLQRDELGRTPGQRTGPPRPIAQRYENEHWLEAATRLCVLDDGLPGRLDPSALSCKPQHAAGKWRKESLKAAGNAIVPQVAHAIFQAIAATDQILNPKSNET